MTFTEPINPFPLTKQQSRQRDDAAEPDNATAWIDEADSFPREITSPTIHDSVLRLLDEGPPYIERRWTPRVQYVRSVCIRLLHGKPGEMTTVASYLSAVTTDISFGGVGLLTWSGLPRSEVILDIGEVSFLCEVCWCARISDGVYRCGLRFLGE